MDNKQLTSRTLRVLGIIVILAMLFLLNWIANKRMPHIMQYGLPAILILCIVGFSILFYRLNVNLPGKPLHEFSSMLWILTILVIALSLVGFFDKDSEAPDWIIPVMIVTAAMWSIYGVFKQQQKRIDELEEELKQQKLLQKINQQ